MVDVPDEAAESVTQAPPDPRRRQGEAADSAVEKVAAQVRRSVLSGALPPGQKFSIAELSAQLGVSHIPVREALRRLEAQGLIVLRPGRSAMVSPLDRDELRAIFRLRQMLEPDLAARSCSMLTDDDFAEAERLLSLYVGEESDITDDADYLWTLHHDLHMVYLRPAATEWDLRILTQLWNACDRYTRVVFDTYAVPSHNRKSREVAHRALYAAARSGSPAEIRRAISEHLSNNEAACLSGIAALALR
ncbi:GntR family transcriptional regulator [Actinocorallia sp. A-T 12471]|uniref:GntR family transcriptional regulator n=1 Tax=Actinocorallia sp. A-T 12471 TaxID=3089813 RepID=UPI0029D28CD0|nr:GntR family transcriptional regulator [Actinocorallia sp. A-T 12471]MDX6739578.1 GntR family transcriptional regulator [Actinocorallia sp. A-T 12471]